MNAPRSAPTPPAPNGDVEVVVHLSLLPNGQTEVMIASADDDPGEVPGDVAITKVTIPKYVIATNSAWKFDPFDLLHDAEGCGYDELGNRIETEEIRALTARARAEHDEHHEGPAIWCARPVCQMLFARWQTPNSI